MFQANEIKIENLTMSEIIGIIDDSFACLVSIIPKY
jgi:hypothetical protein